MNGRFATPGCDDETIRKIQRLFDEPLPLGTEQCPWHCPPGGVVDCNALLSIRDDRDFVDAVVWQTLGHETVTRQRHRWLKRLRRSSRTCVMATMRYKSEGRRHAVKMPGLWFAVILNPPGHRFLMRWYVGRILDRIRFRAVAWRYRKFTARQCRSFDQCDRSYGWKQAASL